MKKVFTLLLIVSFVFSYSQRKEQKLKEYTASNGITYKIGDEIKLTRGSSHNGKFIYVTIGGWGMSTDSEANMLPAANRGLIVTIKKIKKYNYKRYKGVIFTVGGGNITNYKLDIEGALENCEIENCNQKENKVIVQEKTKYEKIKELKELLDSGAITEDEYETEKKKLLDQ